MAKSIRLQPERKLVPVAGGGKVPARGTHHRQAERNPGKNQNERMPGDERQQSGLLLRKGDEEGGFCDVRAELTSCPAPLA